jgi:Ser/Thr protein kinase RdoA (MazF antagonist)
VKFLPRRELLLLCYNTIMNQMILAQFGLDQQHFLGKGSESHVYALDDRHILRIYPAGSNLAYLAARQQFYQQLAEQQPTYAYPQIVEQGTADGHPYTIEVRMRGSSFAQMLPQLHGSDRIYALQSYLDLAYAIGTIRMPMAGYGELIDLKRVQQPTWPAYLRTRIAHNLQISRADLQADVPDFKRLLREFAYALQDMNPTPPAVLVHGDYFPGNVFIDETHTVYGVGDFGYSTLIGDAAMDLAGAIGFIELVEGYQPHDSEILLEHLATLPVRVEPTTLAFYRLYYSLYFGHCKHDDPITYAWCVGNLRQYQFRYA